MNNTPSNTPAKTPWYRNEWLVAILGGALAAFLTGLSTLWLNDYFNPPPPPLPASSRTPVTIEAYPQLIEVGQRVQVDVCASGLTPSKAIELDLTMPGGGTFYGQATGAGQDGKHTFSFLFPSEAWQGDAPEGAYYLVIRDKTTGGRALATVRVLR